MPRQATDLPVAPYLVVFVIPAALAAGFLEGGVWLYLVPVIAFVLVPLLDLVLPEDTRNPSPDIETELEERKAFRLVTWALVPVLWGATLWGAWTFVEGNLAAWEAVGLVLSTGIAGGAGGINFAHELGHRPNRFERGLSDLLLWTVWYSHWRVEHVQGHHANVATPGDPATAKLGQSFYGFWLQTVAGTLAGAWRIESRRLERLGKPTWHPGNRVLRGLATQLTLAVAAWWWLGPEGVIFYCLHSVIGFSLLELVNYVEHYGLQRRETSPGRYEPVTPLHSWNNSSRVSNWFLINLQRHSDHHAAPQRRYQSLRHHDESPQLPTGYAGMILLALVPPLWKRVMDPRVAATAR